MFRVSEKEYKYFVPEVEGDFITKVFVDNADDEELYYFELFNYGCDVAGGPYLQFENYPNEDMVLKGIEEELDFAKGNFLGWHLYDLFDQVVLYDINTSEEVDIPDEEKEFLKVSGGVEHIIELESYEVAEIEHTLKAK